MLLMHFVVWASHKLPEHADERPLIAATMFGVTTPCVTRLRERLERSGFEVVVFHATGSGGRAMEKLIADGFLKALQMLLPLNGAMR